MIDEQFNQLIIEVREALHDIRSNEYQMHCAIVALQGTVNDLNKRLIYLENIAHLDDGK